MSKQTVEDWIKRHKLLTVLLGLLVVAMLISKVGESLSAAADRRAAAQAEAAKTPEMIKAEQELAAKQQAHAEAEQKEWEASKAGKICKSHPDWDRSDCELIAVAKVRIGMSPEQAKASWGTPEDINRTVSTYGTREQWVYGGNYLYFEDGILTSIQN